MYHELSIRTPQRDFSVFLQKGFYNGRARSPFHNHNYTEVQLILNGNATFAIEGQKCQVGSGTMLVIRRKALHTCAEQEEGTLRSAFQINCALPEDAPPFQLYTVDESLLRRFFEEIARCGETGDYTLLSAFIALLCCYFYQGVPMELNRVPDYGFAIHEFFLTHYNQDARLSDLADALHLSERQAERLVLAHTGATFRKTLAATRAMIAKQLMHATEMPLSQIAEYVGYRSYAGFWKAMKSLEAL